MNTAGPDNDKKNFIRDKIEGCIFGGALGDALGYAVEFKSYREIASGYGSEGIQKPHLTDGKTVVSDDTQMTLFTMEGMINGFLKNQSEEDKEDLVRYVYYSYLYWLKTQGRNTKAVIPSDYSSELVNVREMNQLRAPGTTCLSALASGKMGEINNRLNDSKGCGGVMRTAPLGFVKCFGSAMVNGADAAAITHSHPLGWIPAGMLSDIIEKIIYGRTMSLEEIIKASLSDTVNQYKDYKDIVYFEKLISTAIELAHQEGTDVENIESLGGGWVGEEALAIAIYCCIKYSDDMRKMLIASVNHGGDSDSTGAIAGNILGAYLGMDAVPKDWLECLEMKDVMRRQINKIMLLID